MSHRCPQCHGSRFLAARLEQPLALVLDDGRRCALQARVCDDCGRVEFVAPHEITRQPPSAHDVQQSDF
jgi:ribosomal protein S27AE